VGVHARSQGQDRVIALRFPRRVQSAPAWKIAEQWHDAGDALKEDDGTVYPPLLAPHVFGMIPFLTQALVGCLAFLEKAPFRVAAILRADLVVVPAVDAGNPHGRY